MHAVSESLRSAVQRLWRRAVPLRPSRKAQLELLHVLVVRELESKYKGSTLGNLWPIVHQLSQLAIYTYVFAIILKVKLNLEGLPSNNFMFGLWLYAGLLPWTAFVNGLVQATSSVVMQPNLVKKIVFPLGLLPLVPILAAFVESTIGLMALLLALALATQTMQPTVLLLPLAWLPQLLLVSGLGYLTAGLTAFVRDIPQSLVVILNMWFYVTPIVYPATVIPEQWRELVFWVNPLATIVEFHREILLVGRVTYWGEWTLATAIALGVFLGGLWVYRRLRPGFADVL